MSSVLFVVDRWCRPVAVGFALLVAVVVMEGDNSPVGSARVTHQFLGDFVVNAVVAGPVRCSDSGGG